MGERFAVDHDACGIGFIAQLGGGVSRQVVERALEALRRLAHRGGLDADSRSGDGAGLLTTIPVDFLRAQARELGISLPATFAVGMVFLPQTKPERARTTIEHAASRHGLRVCGWRRVPVDESVLGRRAADSVPAIEQVFLSAEGPQLETQLFRMRKTVESQAPAGTYFCSLSSRTIVYKGLLTPEQLPAFYPDLLHPEFASRIAIFHQRYSTNTQPSWPLAQPFRLVAHNGEINTIRGNRRWLRARAPELARELGLEADVALLEAGLSDSGSFDNAFEICLRRGYEPAEAMLALVPPVADRSYRGCARLRRFLDAQASRQEPWDGPAAMVFSDGIVVGAKLDRNGLRPLRTSLTSDGLLVVGSESGIADLHSSQVVERSRLGPGELLLANLATGALLRPRAVAASCPRPRSRSRAVQIRPGSPVAQPDSADRRVMAALGWTQDQVRLLFEPLSQHRKDAVWSMGDDAAPAVLSAQPRSLWDYCKQRFAQVTNPPIDSLREAHVMSLQVHCGGRASLQSPLIDAEELRQLEATLGCARRISTTFDAGHGRDAALAALQAIRAESRHAVAEGCGLVILSDRDTRCTRAALPILLAAAAAWRAMEQAGGWRTPLIVETGEAFDTHHIALLVACGVAAVFPYLALSYAVQIAPDGAANYRAAIEAGLLKVLARMGISTLASYRNSQLFETVGLAPEVNREFFPDADAVLGGKPLTNLLDDVLRRHAAAFTAESGELRDAGLYRFRKEGEQHASSPDFVRRMHRLVRGPTEENYQSFTELAEQRAPVTIRDLLEIVPGKPLTTTRAESEASILSRFSTQAMSLGAISPEAHRTLAIAMNRLGGRSNTGEGGEAPELRRQHPEAANRIKQIASGRFGVTAEYLAGADELEIKMAQGSKPGEGGQLPATKVTPYIAALRHASPNMALISPPPHHDIYSIEDLAQLIYDLRAVNPMARIGVKLVASAGVGIIAAGVVKAGADVITISGHDGGTGASPLTSIKNTGVPWEAGLREAHETLVRAGLRGRVRLRVDGGLKFARDVLVAALLGADEFGFATSALVAIGCVMARQCHLNTCPVGIATQNETLRVRFAGNPEMVEAYFRGLAAEVRQRLGELGAASLSDLAGRVEYLRPRTPEAARIVEPLLRCVPTVESLSCHAEEPSHLPLLLNQTLEACDRGKTFAISNVDRAIGAHLSGELIRRRQSSGEPHGPLEYEFHGTAGQSFGAFLTAGVTLRLNGDANDYVGKGLSGGTIAITAGEEASARGDVLAGNTVLYGATGGELYIAGRAGERFAVRNSGAVAVVEGVGQHGCEYMTAGIVVVLGDLGANFGAGMTGGLAYVLQITPEPSCNTHSVRQASVSEEEEVWLRGVLRRHLRFTGSPVAARMLLETGRLPLRRVEPRQPCATVAEIWERIAASRRGSALPQAAMEGDSRDEPAVQ